MARLSPRIPPLAWLGLVGVFSLLFLLLPVPAEREPWWTPANLRLMAFFVVMIGFYAVCLPGVVRRALASTEELSGIDEPVRAAFRDALVALPLSWVAIFLGIGAAVHMRILSVSGITFASHLDPNIMLSVLGPARLLGWLHVMLLSISMAVLLRHAVLFRSLGARLRDVDLLEHGPLAPFVQASFRTALLFVSWWACTAAFHVRWEGDLSLDPLMLSLLPTQALFTVAVFLLPLLGVHKRLREARDAELARVHRAIRGDRVALRASLIGSHAEALSVVDLFLYREQVRSLSTWPFDAAAIVRLALLTAVPVLGWLGGALVERALGVFLD